MGMFEKATKKKSKLRLALFGVSGGGKTYSALRIAQGLGKRIALIDTEHGSASKYSDRFEFDVCDLDKPSIANIQLAMNEAKNYDVLIIDSLTHAWSELLQEVDKIAKAKFGGNNWSAWSEGNVKQNSLINSILDFPGHIIVTMRAETNWTTTVNDKGKVVPVRIGEAPKQGKNIEFEFDMLIQISQEHQAVVLKDRTGKYQDEVLDRLDEKFGESLNLWLQEGEIDKKTIVDVNIVQEEFNGRVIEEQKEATNEQFVEEFKVRIKKLLDVGQIKLFMKQNNLTLKEPETIKGFMKNKDLELAIALFLEEVGK